MAMRSHLFPFRTQKLSSFAPTILGWRRLGKIGWCRQYNNFSLDVLFLWDLVVPVAFGGHHIPLLMYFFSRTLSV